MTGQPRTRAALDAIHAALTERAEDDQSTLDVVTDHIAAGGSLVTLAQEIAASRASLYRYLKRTYSEETATRLQNARREAAPQLVDRAEEIIAGAPIDSREALQRSKWLADLMLFRAEKADPAQFGSKTHAHVTVDLGQLHLSALKQRAVQTTAAAVALPSATDETIEAEIVEHDAA